MTCFVLVTLALALVATVLALCREMRLRRALERLLKLVLFRWRNNEKKRAKGHPLHADDYEPAERL